MIVKIRLKYLIKFFYFKLKKILHDLIYRENIINKMFYIKFINYSYCLQCYSKQINHAFIFKIEKFYIFKFI